MKKTYTKKQIQEAIAYWKKQLKESGLPSGPDGKPAYAYVYLTAYQADRDADRRTNGGDIFLRNEKADLSELKKQYKLVFDYRT